MISVSYLTSKFSKEETIKKIDMSNCDYIHSDLIDGEYVDGKNFTIEEIVNDLENVHKQIDFHLMVNNPLKYIPTLVKLNTHLIIIHLDILDDVSAVLKYIKNNHILAGVAINPNEDVTLINKYLDLIDYVLVMGVTPGKGGQKFIMDTLTKIEALKKFNLLIGVDGGVNNETLPYLKKLNIDNYIVGSYICQVDDFNTRINEFK